MNDKQAWLRFVLGFVALAGVVWGARGNIDGVQTKADSAYVMAYDNAGDIDNVKDLITEIRLDNKETVTRQQSILTGQAQIRADQKEFTRMVISELKRLELGDG